MCLLAICKTKPIKKEYFEKAFWTNDDGFGFAFIADKKLHYFKGMMKVEEAWNVYHKWVKERVRFPHVIHFRMGKPKLPELTHPFEVSDLSPLSMYNSTEGEVLFHNGVVSGWKDRMFEAFVLSKGIPEGPMIDTRTVAILYNHLGKGIFNYVDGKWVVFSPKHLLTFGEFKEDDGILYSNDSYKPTKSTSYGYGSYNAWNNRQNNQQALSGLTTKIDPEYKELIDEFIV